MNNKGVTLIELMVALAIFSIATVFLAYTITATIRHNFRNSLRDMATTVLNNKINEIKSMDYDDDRLKTSCGDPEEIDDPLIYIYKYGKADDDNITYIICYEIEDVNIEDNETVETDNSTLNFENKFKRIRVTVKWEKPYAVNEEDNITAVFYKSQEYY